MQATALVKLNNPSRARRLVALALAVAAVGVLPGCSGKRITADPQYFPPPPATPHVVHLKTFNALSDVVALPQNWLDVLRGRLVSPFAGKPAGIAYRDGHLYVCDLDLNAVHDWDLATGSTRRWGESGEIVLRKPVDVAAGADGTLYIADTERGSVVVLSPSDPAREWHADRPAYRPVAVAVDGATLAVADVAAHHVDLFDTATGELRASAGDIGDAPGKFYFPSGVAFDASHRLCVSDMLNGRVQVLGADLAPILAMGQPGNRYGDMGKPRHLAVGPDGVIFIADGEFQHVHLFDGEGRLLMLLGGPDAAHGATPMPVGVAVAPSVPESIAALVPADFAAQYYLFVTNSVGPQRIALYAVGLPR